jgi:hypothetical protein
MNITTRLLVAATCISLFGITCLSARSSQRSTPPSETAQRFYEMMAKGEIGEAEKLFLLPSDTRDIEVVLKMSMSRLAWDFKRRGGIRSFSILTQNAAGGYAEVEFEYTLADGTGTRDKLSFKYDNGQWKILIDQTKPVPMPNEIAALASVIEISKGQVLYSVTKGGGKFTDLETLGREGLIDSELMFGDKQGYLFTSTPIVVENLPAMFDTTAKPRLAGVFGTGNRSYYCNETLVIYETHGGQPPSATPSDRVPKNGSTLDR